MSASAEVVPLDPRAVFDDAAAYYRKSPAAERVEVRAFSESRTRAESLTLIITPPATLRLHFGDMILWSDSTALRVFHRLDERGYFEAPVEGGDLPAALERTLPPFPLPQLALAFSDDPAMALTPYASGLKWTEAHVQADGQPPLAVVIGEGERCRATLTIDASNGRVMSMTTVLDDGRARIELTAEALGPTETPVWSAGVERRRRVEDVTLLRPRPGIVLVGEALPDLGLLEWRDEAEQPVVLAGPAVLILYRNWRPGKTPTAALAAARLASESIPSLTIRPALVIPATQAEPRAFIDAAQQEVLPLRLSHSYSPERSIERFTDDADRVAVVIDAGGVVRAIIELTDDEGGAGEVERLASRIVESLR